MAQRPPDELAAQLARVVARRTATDVEGSGDLRVMRAPAAPEADLVAKIELGHGSPGERIHRLEQGAAGKRKTLSGNAVRRFDAAVDAARAHILDEAVGQHLDATPDDEVYEIPDFALEELRATVKAALDTIKKLDGVTSARWTLTDATRYTPEHARFWRLAKVLHPDNRYIQWGVANYGKYLPNVLYVVAGVLAGFDLALKATDPKAQKKILHTVGEQYDLSLRGGLHDVFPLLQAVQFVFTLAGGVAIARLIWQGKRAAALEFFQAFTAAAPQTKSLETAKNLTKWEMAKANFGMAKAWRIPLRTLSFATSLLQLVHGVVTLLSSSSTDSERLEAAWETLLGASGLAGAGATGLNITWLAEIAGPATFLLLSVGAGVSLGRKFARDDELDETLTYVTTLLSFLQEGAVGVAVRANELDETLRFKRQAESESSSAGPEVAAATQRRAERQSAVLRDKMLFLLDQLEDPKLRVPMNVRDPFADIKRRAVAASTPLEVLAAAANFLDIVRDLLGHFERTVARSLQELDAKRKHEVWAWDLPIGVLLLGLHDDRVVTKRAALDEKPPAPVGVEMVPGEVKVLNARETGRDRGRKPAARAR